MKSLPPSIAEYYIKKFEDSIKILDKIIAETDKHIGKEKIDVKK